MTCFMFPGQPMARKDMPVEDPLFLDMARLCQDVTGFNPMDDSLTVPPMTENMRLQLFGTVMCLYRSNLLLRQGMLPDVIAEHSMGIYPALSACGSVDIASALGLTGRIGACLAAMGAEREYAVGSVIGLVFDPLVSVAANNGVYLANHNTSRHFLLAGQRQQIELALKEAEAAGAFSVSAFSCDASYHTPLVEAVADDLQRIVADYAFREPQVPLLDHLAQRQLTAAYIPAFLVDELCRPVYWEKTYLTLRQRGVHRFQEVGFGAALTKFNRWIDSEQ